MCNHETRETGAQRSKEEMQSLARAVAWDQAHLYWISGNYFVPTVCSAVHLPFATLYTVTPPYFRSPRSS